MQNMAPINHDLILKSELHFVRFQYHQSMGTNTGAAETLLGIQDCNAAVVSQYDSKLIEPRC